MTLMNKDLLTFIIFIIAFNLFVIPVAWTFVYPGPKLRKVKLSNLNEDHNESLKNYKIAIEKAEYDSKGGGGGTIVVGGAEPWRQAGRDVERLRLDRDKAIKIYEAEKENINKLPM